MLVHSGDIDHHELAAVAERVKSLESRMTALQTPEAVPATALEQVNPPKMIVFCFHTIQAGCRVLLEVPFFEVIIKQWLDAYTIPFAVQGHASPHDTAFPHSMTCAGIAESKKAAMPTLKTGVNGYAIESISYTNSTGAVVSVYEARPTRS